MYSHSYIHTSLIVYSINFFFFNFVISLRSQLYLFWSTLSIFEPTGLGCYSLCYLLLLLYLSFGDLLFIHINISWLYLDRFNKLI